MVIHKMTSVFPSSSTIRMLGVGAGSGEIDSKMAASIRSCFEGVYNTVVEPSSNLIYKYRQLAKTDEKLRNIGFEFHQKTIEEYWRETDALNNGNTKVEDGDCSKGARQREINGGRFHFISAVHSLYHVDNPSHVVGRLYDMLEEGGVLLVIQVAGESGQQMVRTRFQMIRTPSMLAISSNVVDWLNRGSNAIDTWRQENRLDITCCSDPRSHEGSLLVDFIFDVTNLRDHIPDKLYREIVDFMLSERCSEKAADDHVLMSQQWDAVVTQKTASLS